MKQSKPHQTEIEDDFESESDTEMDQFNEESEETMDVSDYMSGCNFGNLESEFSD